MVGASRTTGDIPPVHFADSKGARIAYQLFGSGTETVVSVPPLAQNIEMAWERPEIRAMLERFAGFARWLVFDKRGTGSSDRTSHIPGLDERVDDLKAVMDHAGVEEAHLMGTSEGGPMAILFAASYPARTKSLILHATGARIFTDEQLEMVAREPGRQYRMADVWGTPESPVAEHFAPTLAADPEFRRWHRRYERRSASRDSMRDLIDLSIGADVTEVLATLDVPTLVQHRVGDRAIPVAFGRALAEGIPGAELIEYEGNDHFTYAGDMESMVADIERWVTENSADRHRLSTRVPSRSAAPRASLSNTSAEPAGTVRRRPGIEPAATEIVTLGRFAVVRDGSELAASDWGSRIPRQLCKRLVAARGWPVTREQLIDQLWANETDMGRLSARLSVHLSAVRRVLGDAVVSDRETVRLDLDHVQCDFHTLMTTDDETAVTIYGGEFLPDDMYEDWASPGRTEARRRFVEAAGRLARASLEVGDDARAVELTTRIIAADSYDQQAHLTLVSSLIAAGRIGEAQQAHDRYRAAMAELDIGAESFDDMLDAARN